LKFVVIKANNKDNDNNNDIEENKQFNDVEVDVHIDNQSSSRVKIKENVHLPQLLSQVELLNEKKLAWPNANACPFIRALVFHVVGAFDLIRYEVFEKNYQSYLELSLKHDKIVETNENDDINSLNSSQDID